MLSEELLKKIQRFHFRTKFLANDLFAGQYESAFVPILIFLTWGTFLRLGKIYNFSLSADITMESPPVTR